MIGKKNRNLITVFILLLSFVIIIGTFSRENKVTSDSHIQFNLSEDINLSIDFTVFQSSSISLLITETNTSNFDFILQFTKFTRENNIPNIETIRNDAVKRSFNLHWIAKEGGVYILTLLHTSVLNSTDVGYFSYIIEWRDTISIRSFIPIVLSGIALVVYHILKRYKTKWSIKLNSSSKFLLTLKYYQNISIDKNLYHMFIVICVLSLDPLAKPGSYIVFDQEISDNISSNLLFIYLFWALVIYISLKLFSNDFMEVAYQWTYPTNKSTIWLIKFLMLIKEIVKLILLITIFWILIKYFVFMQYYYIPVLPLISLISNLILISVPMLLLVPTLFRYLNKEAIWSMLFLIVGFIEFENGSHSLLPHLTGIEYPFLELKKIIWSIIMSVIIGIFSFFSYKNLEVTNN